LYAIFVIKFPPKAPKLDLLDYVPEKSGSVSYIRKNWLHLNKWGLYDMYIQGAPFERGVINGRLAQELIYTQEKIFVDEIRNIVKSKIYLSILKYVVAWINRKLKNNFGREYDLEIYGVSLSASKDFKLIGPAYMRLLNYHAAHDIGHMLQDMKLVGCTSFAMLGSRTVDGKIIHARNFDFYIGDEFCKEKIVTFYAPDTGNKFVMITWGALIGTVSGMNMKGLAITVNAAKSKLSVKVATPVTILIRKMLQYATNIDEAVAIARETRIFVSESILISSGCENRMLIIEKTPYRTEIFEPGTEKIICTNHFQSDQLKNDPLNMEQIEKSASMYRYKRVEELLDEIPVLSVKSAVDVLRDRKGLGGISIGYGNEKAINQLLAHHSVIFCPADLKLWVSAGSYGLGEFICYELDKVFNNSGNFMSASGIVNENETIEADKFLKYDGYCNFEKFKAIKSEVSAARITQDISHSRINEMIASNPDYYVAYWVAGDYFCKRKKFNEALAMYEQALHKEIATAQEQKQIMKKRDFCAKKLSRHT